MKETKKMYVEPKAELFGLSTADVIQTSGPVPETHTATADWNPDWNNSLSF